MDDPAADAQDLPVKDLPPSTVIVRPSDGFCNSKAKTCLDVSEDMVVDSEKAPETSSPGLVSNEGISTQKPTDATITQVPVGLPSSDVQSHKTSADPSEERGWLHRDLMTNTETVPLALTSDPEGNQGDVVVEGENHDRDSNSGCVPDTNVDLNLPLNSNVEQLVGKWSSDLRSAIKEVRGTDTSLPDDPSPNSVPVQPLGDHVTPNLQTLNTDSKEGEPSQQSSKNGSTSSMNRTTNLEAKKNRLLDILNAKTKDLSVGAQKEVFPVRLGPAEPAPSRGASGDAEVEAEGNGVFELPPNTEVIRPSSVAHTPEPMDIDSRDAEQVQPAGRKPDAADDEPYLIINKPVTQIMAKSKRKAKKPLPKRSSLESMIDAASDPTDFFSIANTLDDSEEEDVSVVREQVASTASQTAEAPKRSPKLDSAKQPSPTKVLEAAVPALPTVTAVSSTHPSGTTAWIPRPVDATTHSQPASTVTINTFHSYVQCPSNPQQPAPPTSVMQQPVNPQPAHQLGQPAQYVQQVLQPQQPQQPQLSLLQQKLIQPLQQGGLLQQGQILLQGNLVQGNILQAGLTAVGGTQQAGSTGNLIVQQPQQQQQTQQQYVPVQHVQVGSPIIQQTAVMPPVYQGQLPVIQPQTAQQLPVVSAQQTNTTVFSCSSATPTTIKPQQTVFVLQRGDTLKLDGHGNLIVIGRVGQEGPSGQVPIIQPGSSILPVNTVKNLLSMRHQCGPAVSEESVLQPGIAVVSAAGHSNIASVTPSKSPLSHVTPSVVSHASVGQFNVVIGKQPIASVQPQRQKSVCPNPELDLIRSASVNTSTGTPTPTASPDVAAVKSGTVMSSGSSNAATTPTSTKGGIKIFQCEKCKKLFVSKASLFNHLAAEMHTDNIPEHVKLPYKCSFCEARFAFKASLTFHCSRDTCVPDKPMFNIICSICKLRFKALVDLERHVVRCHHLLPCQNPEFVDKDSVQRPDEKRGIIVVQGSPKILPKAVTVIPDTNPATNKWNVANKRTFESRPILYQENTSKTETNNPEQRPPIKLVMSVKRKKKGKHRGRKRRSRSVASHNDSESHCVATVLKDEDASTRNLINTHGRYINKSTRPFSCKICSKGFNSEHCLLEHIKTHIRPFSCSICGWKSARKDNVLKHIQLQHDGPKYRRKRAGKTKRELTPSPVSTEDEEEDMEEAEGEVKPIDEGEDDRSDNEDPDIELEDDDKPNDYFGSGMYDGCDDNGDNDNSGGSYNKDSNGQTDKEMPRDQVTDNRGATTTPGPQDHNYSTQMQSASDSTGPAQESGYKSPKAQDDDEPISESEPKAIISGISTTSCEDQSQVKGQHCHQTEAGESRPTTPKQNVCPEKQNGSDGPTSCQKAVEISSLNEKELNMEDAYPCNTSNAEKTAGSEQSNSSHNASHDESGTEQQPESIAEDENGCDLEPCVEMSKGVNKSLPSTEETTEWNGQGVKVLPFQDPVPSESLNASPGKHNDVALLESNPVCGEEKDVESEVGESNGQPRDAISNSVPENENCIQTCSASNHTAVDSTNQAKQPSSPDEELQSNASETISEMLPQKPAMNSDEGGVVKDKCNEVLLESECDSDGDVLEWTSSERDSDDESAMPDVGINRIQSRPILLRDDEECQSSSTPTMDGSVIIDDDNLEIRPKQSRTPSPAFNSKAPDPDGDVPSTYYTVLNAEGSDVDMQEDSRPYLMDAAQEAEVPGLVGESVKDFPASSRSSEAAEMECQEGRDGSWPADVSQVQAKCDIPPDVRVKTEYLTPSDEEMVGSTDSASCDPQGLMQQESPQKDQELQGPEQEVVSGELGISDQPRNSANQVQMDSRERVTPDQQDNQHSIHKESQDSNLQVPRQDDGETCVKIKQEPLDAEVIEPQVPRMSSDESTNSNPEHQAQLISPACSTLTTEDSHVSKSLSTSQHRDQLDKQGPCLERSKAADLVNGQPPSPSSAVPTSTGIRPREHQASEPSNEQVLPVISAVGSLRDPANRIEGVSQQRKSVILEALNRPSQPFPPQQFGASSPGYDPRVLYNSMGMPVVDPSAGQPYVPRLPRPGNPYISLIQSGSLVDPREQYFSGHPSVPPVPPMGYSHRPPHMGVPLPESRFPHPNGYPPMTGRGDGYQQQQEHQGLEKQLRMHKMHQDKQQHLLRQKQWNQQKHQHQHLNRHPQERQQQQQYHLHNEYPPHPTSHQPSQPTFPSVSPGSGQPERFVFPKYPYEDRGGGHFLPNPNNREGPDAILNSRQIPQNPNPHDLQIVPRPREFAEFGKQAIHLEQNNNTHGMSSLPIGNPFAPMGHDPVRPPIPVEAPIAPRPPVPIRPGLPGPTAACIHVDEPIPNHGVNLPQQMSHGIQNGNDQPPPLVYQGPQKPQDLSLQKPAEKQPADPTSKDAAEEDKTHPLQQIKGKASVDAGKSVLFQEYANVPQSESEFQGVSSPRENMQMFHQAPLPAPPAPPAPPPPPPPPLHSAFDNQAKRPHYGQGDITENRASQPPLAHQHHPPPEYIPGANESFAPPPIHTGPMHVSPNLPSPQSLPRTPKRRHSSAGSLDQEPAPRRRKRSPRVDDNPEDRPYACHICGSRFKRSNNLTDHVRIHSRPYKCGECSFDTTRWQYLADHLKKNHNFEGDARELEMMFKSGKRLKPTDHIPETCYQPVASEVTADLAQASPHPIRNGFSPGSRSMVVPSSTIVLPRGTDIVHQDKHRKRKHRGDDDRDEDLVDFFGLSSSQDDEDETVTPITVPKEEIKDEFDDAASGSANGAQISPGSAQAQTSPKGSPITSPKPEPSWSKRKQLNPVKVTDEDFVQDESNSEFQTADSTVQENTETSLENDPVTNEVDEHVKEEGKMNTEIELVEENDEESAGEDHENQDDDTEEEDKDDMEDKEDVSYNDADDQDYTPYHVASKANRSVEESDEEVMYTPTGRPKRKTGNYTFQPKQRRSSENDDPEYKPNRQKPWKKKRGIMLKIHVKRGRKRGRPRTQPISESLTPRVEALSTHVGGGLDLTPYYTIVETSERDVDRRPYQCTINECNKRFKSKQHMREHLFTHLKPYKCDGCGVGFARTDYLAMHMRDMHKMSPTRADLFNKRKCANGRAMACRMRPSKDKRRQELQQSFRSGKEL